MLEPTGGRWVALASGHRAEVRLPAYPYEQQRSKGPTIRQRCALSYAGSQTGGRCRRAGSCHSASGKGPPQNKLGE